MADSSLVVPSHVELSLLPPTTLRVAGGSVCVTLPTRTLTFEEPDPPVVNALRHLANGGVICEAVEAEIERDGVSTLSQWYYCIETLEEVCALGYVVREGEEILLEATPMHPAYHETWELVVPEEPASLSRFACIRRAGHRWILESPLALVRVDLPNPSAVALLAQLAVPCTPEELASNVGVSIGAASSVMAVLHASGFLTTREDEPALAMWEFADLMLHARSRLGRHDDAYGGTYGFRDAIDPLPAVRPPSRGASIPLPRPDLQAAREHDPPFVEVLESRASHRHFSGTPLTVEQLSEFLYRSARIGQVRDPTPQSPHETSRRPYPSGGACYPLEVYLAVDRCDGLKPGLYHYDPRHHAVSREASIDVAGEFLDDARVATAADARAPVLVILSARFARSSWKYRSIAYATILKDVGVLLQTMYLVATAMGLAGCAVGGGNATAFANAIGTVWHEESSVGEFVIGLAHATP